MWDGLLVDVKEQVGSDLANVKKGLEMIVPPAVMKGIGQGIGQSYKILGLLAKSVWSSAAPKLHALVVNEGQFCSFSCFVLPSSPSLLCVASSF